MVPAVPVEAVVKSKQLTYTPSSNTREADAAVINQDGSSSLEDLFGLGNNQLRELMEQELPVPREDLITKKEVTDSNTDKNKVFKLPDLSEFMDSATGTTGQQRKPVDAELMRVDRSNRDEYLRVLQLNPFADADDSMFLDEVRQLCNFSFFFASFHLSELRTTVIRHLTRSTSSDPVLYLSSTTFCPLFLEVENFAEFQYLTCKQVTVSCSLCPF